MREYNAESPKQGRKRFNSVVKTIGFGHLVIIYLWFIYILYCNGFKLQLALTELVTNTLVLCKICTFA